MRTFHLVPTPFALAAFLLASAAAHAQTTSTTPAGDAQSMPTVVVNASADASAEGLSKAYAGGQVARGGRMGILGAVDMMDSPFGSTSYTQQFIADQQARSVGDLLQSDPAVRMSRGYGNFQEVYVIRGFALDSDDVAYNGLYGVLPRQYVSPELLERVEVFRGASAFLNGAAPGGSGIGGAINSDFGRGTLTGGALGLLLGKNKKARKLASYGGLAALGMMVYNTYGEYQRQQAGTAGAQPGQGAQSAPAALPPPQTVDRLPAPQASVHSAAILQAIVGAAKADGHLDARERELIEAEYTRQGLPTDVQQWLHAELEKPLDPSEVARAASSPELAAEMYLASLLVADEQSFMERAYLDELAKQLKLDPALQSRLQRQLTAATGE